MGCRWNRLDKPVFVVALDFRMTRVGDYEKFYALWNPNELLIFVKLQNVKLYIHC